ncbi:MAG: hypothetical protein NZ927_04815 [Candidatus Calescibacterium sp.]|nr:hypothetical protein [Candidatus Calescibacterium sp.]
MLKFRIKYLMFILFALCSEKGEKKNEIYHPYLSRSAWPIVHKNPAQHAGTEFAGPEQNFEVEMFDHRGPGWILFDSQGNIIFGNVDVFSNKHEFKKFNNKMELVASASLSYKNLTGILGGIYSFIDHQDCIWTSTDATIHRLCERDSKFEEDMRFEINKIKPDLFSEDETILSLMPLYRTSGMISIAFLTLGINYIREEDILKPQVTGAKLGIIKINNRESVDLHSLKFEGEAIQNALALDREDNIYVVTNRKAYKIKFRESDGSFEIKWAYTYDSGEPPENIRCEGNISDFNCLLLNYLERVRFFDGSGTTPTLMGDNEEYVGFADGSRPMKVIVLRTKDGTPVEIDQPIPFIYDQLSQTENTFAYINKKFVIENNNPNEKGVACYQIKGEYGREKIELIWVNRDVFAPNAVPLVSGSSELAYFYEMLESQKWFLTALDLNNGKIKFRLPIGNGLEFNSLYSPLNLNDKKEIYIPLFGKILRIKEKSNKN